VHLAIDLGQSDDHPPAPSFGNRLPLWPHGCLAPICRDLEMIADSSPDSISGKKSASIQRASLVIVIHANCDSYYFVFDELEELIM
jgi:hypothetical protein